MARVSLSKVCDLAEFLHDAEADSMLAAAGMTGLLDVADFQKRTLGQRMNCGKAAVHLWEYVHKRMVSDAPQTQAPPPPPPQRS